ncbi:MAG: type VI secretion system contractile sheath small subunit [Planctomycetota bacterium]
MAQDGSVAPKERVNIVYKASTGDAMEEKELPFKTMVLGDFTGRADDTPVEQRKLAAISKDNFDDVLAGHDISISASVDNVLSEEEGAKLSLDLQIKKMSDFTPQAVVEQVPELKKLLELREALAALKGPLGNVPAFRKKIQSIVQDERARDAIMAELQGAAAADEA